MKGGSEGWAAAERSGLSNVHPVVIVTNPNIV